MIERLKKIVEVTNPRVVGQVLQSRENQEIFNWLMSETTLLPKNTSLKERVFYLLLGKPNIYCNNNNKKTFNVKTKTYGFCGNAKKCECLRIYQSENYTPRDTKKQMETREKNLLAKYGVKNVSQLPEVKKKRKETMNLKTYDSIWQKVSYEKETIGYNQVCERVKEYVLPEFTRDEYLGSSRKNIYNWKCVFCDKNIKSHIDYGTIPRCKTCFPKTISKGEIELAEFIRSLGFKIETNIKILKKYEFDIFLSDKKIAFEFNGIYWHSDLKRPKNYHLEKFIASRNEGIKLIQIFEDEWKNKKEIIKNRIRNILGKSKKIYARNCNVKPIDSEKYKIFTNETHLQGYAPALFKYGLFHNEKLVSVMSFSKSRYTNDEYEMIRFCSVDTVVGGAGKLFKYFVIQQRPKSIVSYANRLWSDGNLYLNLGFINKTENDRNFGYWYIKDKRYHRSTFTKSRLINMGMDPKSTEPELMNSMGFLRVFDCGNYKFVWEPKSIL